MWRQKKNIGIICHSITAGYIKEFNLKKNDFDWFCFISFVTILILKTNETQQPSNFQT